MSTPASTNGRPTPNGTAKVKRRLACLGGRDEPEQFDQLLLLQEESDQAPPHDIPRHREDPPAAYEAAAQEVCDPEKIRVYAVGVGKASQAISPRRFKELVRRVYEGISRTRQGAIVGPAQRAGGEQLKISATAETDVTTIVSDRHADGLKADRLQEQLPQLDSSIQDMQDKHYQADAELREADAEVAAVGSAEVADPIERPGGLMQWVRIPPWLLIVASVFDCSVATFTSEPYISDLIDTQIPFGSALIAFGISLIILMASGFAGFTLAAIRLPERAVAGLLTAVFVVIMFLLAENLSELRKGSESGVETLTIVNLAASWIAVLLGYASARWQEFAGDRELITAVGTPALQALHKRDKAIEGKQRTLAEIQAAEAEKVAFLNQIEDLRDSASRADAAASARESAGITADVEFDMIDAIATTGVKQEIAANEQWAVAIAELAYEKARAEDVAEDQSQEELLTGVAPAPESASDELTALQKAAIASLAVAGGAGFVVGPMAVAAGSGLAAALLLIDRRKTKPSTSKTTDPVDEIEPPMIKSPAPEDKPWYYRQPTRMVPKYRNGGPGAGENQ